MYLLINIHMPYKQPKIGIYGKNDRALQKQLSYEKVSMSYHPVNVYRYMGSATEDNPSITDISESLWLENPDRDYNPVPVLINAHVDQLPESPFDLTRFGIINPMTDMQIFRIHINSFDPDQLGRYLVTGDVIEVPFLEQNSIKAFFEVTDVDRKTENETFHVIVTAEPIKDSQEFEEIPGIATNSDALDALQAELDAAAEANVTNVGINSEFDLYTARGYVLDDYFDPLDTHTYDDDPQSPTTYDPRPDLAEGFLDNPNSKIF